MLLPGLSQAAADGPQAVRVGEEAICRQRLAEATQATAARIHGAHMVAVGATPSLATVVAVVAALHAGVPLAPVPPDAGAGEREHILGDCGAELVLGVDPGWDTGRGARLPRVPVRWHDPGRNPALAPAGTGNGPALVLYTSGTTGPPKGVALGRAALAANLDALAEAWAWTAEDVLVHGLPLFHVHGLVLGVLGALRVGARLVHTVRPTPAAYADAAAGGGTLFFGVPTVWGRIAADPGAARALSSARLLVSGSAPLSPQVFTAIAELSGHRPVERYGMTETLITLSARADGQRRPGQVGLPLAGVRTRVTDEHGAPVAHDGATVGELQVQAPTMFDGYLGRPQATAACWTGDGWFRTGDLATIGADGWHRILGRVSTDLISCGGYRIGAGEVESALLAHPGVREAAVVGVPDADLGQVVVAYIVTDAGAGGVEEASLIEFTAGALAAHKRPRRVVVVEQLPRNAMGKVAKARLTG